MSALVAFILALGIVVSLGTSATSARAADSNDMSVRLFLMQKALAEQKGDVQAQYYLAQNANAPWRNTFAASSRIRSANRSSDSAAGRRAAHVPIVGAVEVHANREDFYDPVFHHSRQRSAVIEAIVDAIEPDRTGLPVVGICGAQGLGDAEEVFDAFPHRWFVRQRRILVVAAQLARLGVGRQCQ
jgi:hypothetical protein